MTANGLGTHSNKDSRDYHQVLPFVFLETCVRAKILSKILLRDLQLCLSLGPLGNFSKCLRQPLHHGPSDFAKVPTASAARAEQRVESCDIKLPTVVLISFLVSL